MVQGTILFVQFLVFVCLNKVANPLNLQYSFRRPEKWGSLIVEEADCCPYFSYPANKTSDKSLLPHVIGLGVQKSGSTTLSAFLSRNPDFAFSRKNEVHFMDTDYSSSSLKVYEQQWRERKSKNKVRFELTPSYLWVPFTACRVKKSLPNVKFVVILRNPTERAHSEYNMVRQRCRGSDEFCIWRKKAYLDVVNKGIQNLLRRNCTFTDGTGLKNWNDCFQCLGYHKSVLKNCHYRPFFFKRNSERRDCFYFGGQVVSRGLYAAQLAWWFSFFDPNNFVVLFTHDFHKDPVKSLNRVRDKVGMGQPFTSEMLPKEGEAVLNQGKYKFSDAHKEEAKTLLNEFYSRPNLELYSVMDETNQGPYTPFDTFFDTSSKNLDPSASAPDTSPLGPSDTPDLDSDLDIEASAPLFSDSAEDHGLTSLDDIFADAPVPETSAAGLADAPGPDSDSYYTASDTGERVAEATDLLLNKTNSYPVSYYASQKANLPSNFPSVLYIALSVVLTIVVLRQLLICHLNQIL